MRLTSPLGTILAGIYLVISISLIASQGLFGESFIALILGMPWNLGFAYFEFFGATGAVLVILILLPILLNAVILYYIGKWIDTARRKI